ncbi:hypothetical protein [Streptomyces sp. V3I7]|uniref:hypothetical protein n=1 Tax=Streptomyces sp. V3I7 TaxID=3042278 RepID=UPI00277F79C7|nr:hypothetical protein [Streptomyces sp. V3I7]MDQ0991118.1 hypothetical protein [Streptomyces sp. V3I7]
MIPDFQGEARERRSDAEDRKEKKEEDALEAGLPLKLSPGTTYYGPTWYVSDTSYGNDQLNGQPFNDDGGAAVPSWAWLTKNWTPLSSTGVAVSVESQYKTTVLVQALKLHDVDCQRPLPKGTLLQPPGIGDGGEGASSVEMGMNVDSNRPVTRKVNGLSLGAPYTAQVALDKGDAREFRIIFTTRTRACTFKANLLVNSKGKQYRIPLPAEWDHNGKAVGYTFNVAPPSKAYRSRYVVGNDGELIAVPESDITWVGQRPTYTGDGELNYW